MAQINLAPGTQHLASTRRRQRSLYGLSIVIVIFVALIWLGLNIVQRTVAAQVTESEERLAALETEVARNGEIVDRIDLFEERLSVLDQLLDEHIRWTPLFGELERLLPPEIVFTRLEFDSDNNLVEFNGTMPTIDALALALASLEDSPDRPTAFTDGLFTTVKRTEVKNEEGEVISAGYEFGAALTYTARP